MVDFLLLLFFGWLVWRIKKNAQNVRKTARKEIYEGPFSIEQIPAPKRGTQYFDANPQPKPSTPSHSFREPAKSTLEGYTGSLGVTTMEGQDICDPALGHNRERQEQALTEAEPVAISHTLPFPLTGNAIVQGIVMGEVLAHPAHRKWGSR